jgi:hypothetical protein
MNTETSTETIRIDDATYSRPFPDHQLRPMVAVSYDDGERFVTYAIGEQVRNAWAEVDTFGRQLTETDV